MAVEGVGVKIDAQMVLDRSWFSLTLQTVVKHAANLFSPQDTVPKFLQGLID